MYHKLICTGLSPSMIAFSKTFHFVYFYNVAVLLPHKCRNNRGLGCSPVARHYWGNHCCFIFLQVLRCFSSLRLLTRRYNTSSMYWVAPFGNLRIKGYLHLPAAYRSLSRPSSPVRAQASTIRSYLLLLYFLYFQLTRIPISLLCLLVLIVVVVDYISINFPACQRTMYIKYQDG